MAKKPNKKELAAAQEKEGLRQNAAWYLGLMVFAFSVLGAVCYIKALYNITVICAILALANTLIQLMVAGQRDFGFEIVAVIIGALISRIAGVPLSQWLYVISLVICIADIILQILGWIGSAMLAADSRKKPAKGKNPYRK